MSLLGWAKCHREAGGDADQRCIHGSGPQERNSNLRPTPGPGTSIPIARTILNASRPRDRGDCMESSVEEADFSWEIGHPALRPSGAMTLQALAFSDDQ
ncbi:MAG: hypothetical protein H7831_07410 [Magnetococcus sp. WYHC-3]